MTQARSSSPTRTGRYPGSVDSPSPVSTGTTGTDRVGGARPARDTTTETAASSTIPLSRSVGSSGSSMA